MCQIVSTQVFSMSSVQEKMVRIIKIYLNIFIENISIYYKNMEAIKL